MPIRSILAQADAELDDAGVVRHTLAPGRTRARSLVEIAAALAIESDAAVAQAWARGLAEVALAMHAAFPDNLLWDLDYLGACLWARASGPDGAVEVADAAAAIARMQARFGRITTIAFRYVHDFTYGFDWAKWVAKDPSARGQVGPFAPTFVDAMHTRAIELETVIAEGTDAKYPPLPDGRPRNPFGFSREPADELQIFGNLAREGRIPVETWRIDAHPQWDRPYAELRRQTARALGL